MKKWAIIILSTILVSGVLISSCKKDHFITSPSALLYTNVDSVYFDTVFTTVGSITQLFKIYNANSQKLLLNTVKLSGGTASPFKININGLPQPQANDIEIEANDSMYVFVTVNINPSSANLPFIIRDSILIQYNGNSKFVQLSAYGQNAHFLHNKIIHSNEMWPNDLPYVILGGIQVDTTATLTIDAGCSIYSHSNSPFIVDGTLMVNGTKTNSVIFTGDRLDPSYKNLPASWPGIIFRGESKNNLITHAIIKNANNGIYIEKPTVNSNPKLKLDKCVITNAFVNGIYCFNSNVHAENCLITNSTSNIFLEYGGNYDFIHCTISGYSNDYTNHQYPDLILSNSTTIGGTIVTNPTNASFTNCIFWGDGGPGADEITINKTGSSSFTTAFTNCLYRMSADPTNCTNSANILNQDPLFDSINVNKNYYDFHTTLNSASPVVDKGVNQFIISDLDDQIRPAGLLPDIGCYEKQ